MPEARVGHFCRLSDPLPLFLDSRRRVPMETRHVLANTDPLQA